MIRYKIYKLHKSIESENVPDGYHRKDINRYSLEDIGEYDSYPSLQRAEEVLNEKIESEEVSGQFTIIQVYESTYDIESRSYKMK